MKQVEQGLLRSISANGVNIEEIGRYIFEGRGKRIRPALFLMVARLRKSNLAGFIDGAVALELVHTASLLHDDVIDQAATRRGRRVANERWGNRVAILAGDFLLSRAFQLLLQYRNWSLLEILSEVVQEMAEGEMEQSLAGYAQQAMEDRYFNWIGKKTARFFAGCCRAGSLISGGGSEEQQGWSEFGFHLGMVFQLIDDLLDYTGHNNATGKPLFGDLQNRILTLPLIHTLQSSADSAALLAGLSGGTDPAAVLHSVARAVLEGDGLGYTLRKAEQYAALAGETLDSLTGLSTADRQIFKNLLGYVIERSQ
ncbi:MAG: polyprenyl synthetase family protein [Bacillota bacterium]